MDLISGLMVQQKTQSAEEIIPTLCDRLAHARLASDKRAAILTLKGFSRQYRESVIANGLRGLISTINEYSIDTDIIKSCLETILILFIRGEGDDDMTRSWISQQSRVQNGKYPSPLLIHQESSSIDQFSLWIADEITQGDENITTIVSLLENTDFYLRLYTLQLLEALVSMRPTRTKDLLLNSPLGISSLVLILDDVHEPVRNEAVLLLMAVANDNFNIQKLIAFENTFDKLFEIIHEEGDIRGSIVVQDCLTLVSNLLKYNISNQKLFLETNCLPKLSYLVAEPLGEDEIVWNDQRLQNVEIALDIVRLFVLDGNESTKSNQDSFFGAEIFLYILRLAFSSSTPHSLRPHALLTVADLISKNTKIQQGFSDIDVPYIDPSQPKQLQAYKTAIPVVISLLNWCLFVNSVHFFDIRVAASHLLRAYLDGNEEGKANFLHDQIEEFYNEDAEDGAASEARDISNDLLDVADDTTLVTVDADGGPKEDGGSYSSGNISIVIKDTPMANIFQALLEYDPEVKLNPYKVWFSAATLIYLVHESDDARDVIRGITSGDEESGEEVQSAIQALFSLLLTTLSTQDERISIAYLMVLIVMIYEDFDSVNDFLSDSSNVKSLLQYLSQPTGGSTIVHGLSTILIGLAFEFSSKDSPLSRVDLHALILKICGKDNYGYKVLQFKENSLFADFDEEDILNPSKDDTGLPRVFFDPIVVGLIKDNFYRIKNTLNQDPTLDSNGRISYEKFETVKDQYHGLKKLYDSLSERSTLALRESEEVLQTTSDELALVSRTLKETESELTELRRQHFELSASLTTTNSELEKLQNLHKDLDRKFSHQSTEMKSLGEEVLKKEAKLSKLKQELDLVQTQKQKAEEGINKMSRELFLLTRDREELSNKVKKLEKDAQDCEKELSKLGQSAKQKSDETITLRSQLEGCSKQLAVMTSTKDSIEAALQQEKAVTSKNASLIEQLTDKMRSIATTCNELTKSKDELETRIRKVSDEHTSELQLYKQKVTYLETTHVSLTEVVHRLENEKATLQSEVEVCASEQDVKISAFQSERAEILADLKSAEVELASSKALGEKHEEQIRDLNASLESYKVQVASLENEHKAKIESHIHDHSKKISVVEKQLTDQAGSHIEQLSSLQEKFDELAEEKKRLTSELSSQKIQFAEANSNLEALNNNLKLSDNQLQAALASVATLELWKKNAEGDLGEERAKSESTVSALGSTVQQLEGSVKDLKKTKVNLEAELDDLAAELEAKEAEFESKAAAQKKEITSLKENISSVEAEKKSLSSTMEFISQRVQAKDMESEALVKKLKSETSTVEELRSQLTAAESAKKILELSLSTKDKNLEKREDEISTLKAKLEAREDEITENTASLQALELKLADLKLKSKGEVQSITGELKALKKTLEEKASDFERERVLLSEDSSSTTKEYSEKVTKLEDSLKELNSSTNDKIESLEKAKSQLENSISELNASTAKLEADLSRKELKVDELKKSLKTSQLELKHTESNLSDALKDISKVSLLQTEQRSLETRLAGFVAQLSDAEDKLSKSSKVISALESEKSNLESSKAQVQKSLDECTSRTERLEATYTATLTDLKAELATVTDRSNSLSLELEKSQTESSTVATNSKTDKATLSDKISELESEAELSMQDMFNLRKRQADSQTAITLLTEKNLSLSRQVSSLRDAEKNSKDVSIALDSTKNELATLMVNRSELENLASDAQTLKAQNSKLKGELDALKVSMAEKSELDDMILVMEDLDEKKNKYKALVKKLGGEVSSDEESDNDEKYESDDD